MGGAANGRAAAEAGGSVGGKEGGAVFGGGALLGFEDKAAAFVKIDAANGGVAVAVIHGDGSLEDIGIVAIIRLRGLGAGGVEQGAKLGQEHRIVRPLG